MKKLTEEEKEISRQKRKEYQRAWFLAHKDDPDLRRRRAQHVYNCKLRKHPHIVPSELARYRQMFGPLPTIQPTELDQYRKQFGPLPKNEEVTPVSE